MDGRPNIFKKRARAPTHPPHPPGATSPKNEWPRKHLTKEGARAHPPSPPSGGRVGENVFRDFGSPAPKVGLHGDRTGVPSRVASQKTWGAAPCRRAASKSSPGSGPFPPIYQPKKSTTRTYLPFSSGVLRGSFLSRAIWQAKWGSPVGKHRFLHDSPANFEHPGATPQRTQHTKRTQNSNKTLTKHS